MQLLQYLDKHLLAGRRKRILTPHERRSVFEYLWSS